MPYATQRKSARVGPEADAQALAGGAPSVAQARVGDAPADSPARTLQERLAEDYGALRGLDDGRRWSPRATLALSGGISLALWAGIGMALGFIR
jgi:hypothetical protein